MTALSAPSLPTGVSPPRSLHLPPDSPPPQEVTQEEASLTALLALSLPTGLNLRGRLHPSKLPPPHLLQASFLLVVASQPNAFFSVHADAQSSSHWIACRSVCKDVLMQ